MPPLDPDMGTGQFPAGGTEGAERRSGRARRWVAGLMVAFVYTLLGTVLVLLPWLPNWDQNYFSGSSRGWYSLWMNPYFRGAVSGVGVLNLCISFLELMQLMRRGRR